MLCVIKESYKIHVRKNSIFINNLQKTFWICPFWLSKARPGRIYQFIANSSKPLITTSNIRSLGVSKTPNVRHQVHIITHLSSISGDRASDSSDPRHLDNRRPGEIWNERENYNKNLCFRYFLGGTGFHNECEEITFVTDDKTQRLHSIFLVGFVLNHWTVWRQVSVQFIECPTKLKFKILHTL